MGKWNTNGGRQYNKDWESQFKWLMWKNNNAVCKWCSCVLTNMRKSAISDHEKSLKHRKNANSCTNSNKISNLFTKASNQNTELKQFEALCGSTSLAEEQCHTFAGGAVYPNTEGRASGHNLQWTKAMISKPAPVWDATAVVDGQFKQLKLSDFKGKYVVFFFYPLDFTFVCPTEILAFNDRLKEFHALNAEVLACSIDSHFTHLAWTKTPRKEGGLGTLNIPLVSDLTHSIAKDYGVYLEDQGLALRGLFIIDDKGILRQITMNDLPVGRSVDETLRLVQAFQFTDRHGEVCPAGWKPGDATIIPTPDEAKKYFKEANLQ